MAKTYTVAIGAVGFDTPAGVYHIQNKAVDPVWTVPDSDWAGDLAGKTIPGGAPENPLKARWMGIFDGAGIHGTDDVASLGSAASHGCVRMAVPDVIDLYDQRPRGHADLHRLSRRIPRCRPPGGAGCARSAANLPMVVGVTHEEGSEPPAESEMSAAWEAALMGFRRELDDAQRLAEHAARLRLGPA